MEKLIEYIIEWFKESKSTKFINTTNIIIISFILAIILFWLSFYIKENAEYASTMLNWSLFLFGITFIFFITFNTAKDWKENIYKDIKDKIINIRKILEGKNSGLKISNRDIWENYWTLFSKNWINFLYILDENKKLLSVNLYLSDKEQKEKIEDWLKKEKIKLIEWEKLKDYTSKPNNTILLKDLADIQEKEDEEIVEIILKVVKNIE